MLPLLTLILLPSAFQRFYYLHLRKGAQLLFQKGGNLLQNIHVGALGINMLLLFWLT